MHGLYVHIPFCLRKCPYCAFFSFPSPSQEDIAAYLAALATEIQSLGKTVQGVRFATLYLGGGTPTVLSAAQLVALITQIKTAFALAEAAEITVEANPGTTTTAQLATLRAAGVNRLSLGFQATQDHLLRRLGRIHTWQEAYACYQEARNVGFRNISIDLIYGISGQTLAEWQESLDQVLALAPEHLSIYGLQVEPQTPFGRLAQQGKLLLPGEDFEVAAFRMARERLQAAGYTHYEIASFALPGRRSQHNQLYWLGQTYLGLGAGAHSYWGGWRFSNVADLTRYQERLSCWGDGRPFWQDGDVARAVEEGAGAIAGGEEITTAIARAEYIFLRLRLLEDGVDMRAFAEQFGVSLQEVYGEQIRALTKAGLLAQTQKRLRLTSAGILLANQVMQEFLP